MDLSALLRFCAQEGMLLATGQIADFEQFCEGLYEANRVMNLTRVPYEDCAVRHFVDSLLVARFAPEGSTVLDVGAGPGFPAWPLACARPDLHVTAMDGSNKGLSFLRRFPLPNLEIVQVRAEEWVRREEFELVTGRALAPLAVQLEVSAPWVAVGGRLVPFRTPSERAQVEALNVGTLGLELERIEEVPLAGTEVVRLFPVYVKRTKTPSRYPRRWAEIKAAPLT
ncbi:MAG: 16S rRNA (guanine(527)-N(7))-methyltransferase RsmG [Fimbriimonadaceae bacterium]|nr:16S rRNA (guanine(527)-N(7))-methyltransferase RsmG [Fimbriimonadaceae bacterium]QYK55142.1 MAG: 16S rRNA (guanine(527)-N(7))-methyltransferase RsmG [Fimbriimonadaceae bacterium]